MSKKGVHGGYTDPFFHQYEHTLRLICDTSLIYILLVKEIYIGESKMTPKQANLGPFDKIAFFRGYTIAFSTFF